MTQSQTAVENLLGLTLTEEWRVIEKLPRKTLSSGGTFSSCYLAEKDGKRAFVKALDFTMAFRHPNVMAALQNLTAAYEHERNVLEICKTRKLSKVAVAIGSGDVTVPGFNGIEAQVFYLLFELADGDIRRQIDQSKRLETLWCVQAIRDVCLGLYQVHNQNVAHQDIKPSNVLIFDNDGFRITDFGRSSKVGSSLYYDNDMIAGDSTYAPPELLYSSVHTEFAVRRIGCDMYMLGNLAGYMFTGANMTASILGQLDAPFHPSQWVTKGGKYNDVLPYVQEAFGRVVELMAEKIDELVRADIIPLITQLCNPDPAKRGHYRSQGRPNQYSLERYIGQLNLLFQKTEVKLRVAAAKDKELQSA